MELYLVSKLSTANAQNGGCLFTLRSKKTVEHKKKEYQQYM
jgi:hypothetical protein